MPLAMLGVNDVGTSYALFVTSRAVGSGFTVLGSLWWAVLFVERLVLWRPKATYLALFGEPQRWQVLLAVLVGGVGASALIVNSAAVSLIGSPVPTQAPHPQRRANPHGAVKHCRQRRDEWIGNATLESGLSNLHVHQGE